MPAMASGAVSTVFGVFGFFASEYEFAKIYYFYMVVFLVLISFFNSMILFPIILSIYEPKPHKYVTPAKNRSIPKDNIALEEL